MNSGATKSSVALVLAFTAVIAVLFVVSTQSEESVLLRSEGETQWTEDQLSYFHDAEQHFAEEKVAHKAARNYQTFLALQTKKALAKADKVLLAKTLKNICKLRAFAELAYDKANEIKLERASADSGLLGFVIAFAKEAIKHQDAKQELKAHKRAKELTKKQEDKNKPKIIPDEFYLLHNMNYPVSAKKAIKTVAATAPKPYTYNVIVDYAKAVHAAESVDKRGFSKYLIHHIIKSVKAGKDLTTTITGKEFEKDRVTFDYKALGFTEEPYYFRRIGVSPAKFVEKLAEVEKMSGNADTLAATLWLNQGANNAYMSFMDKEVSEAHAIAKKNFDLQVKAALEAIMIWYRDRGSWDKLRKNHERGKEGPTGMGKVLRPLVDKGIEGASAQSQNDKPIPTYEDIKKAASAAAKSFMKEHQLDKKTDLVNDEIDTVRGKFKPDKKSEPEKPKKKKVAKKKVAKKKVAKKKPINTDFKETSSYTSCSQARGDKLEALASQHVAAQPSGSAVLTGFKFGRNKCGGNDMRYKQWQITDPPKPQSSRAAGSSCSPMRGKHIEYLDRQTVSCGTGVLTSFSVHTSKKSRWCPGSSMEYKFGCNYYHTHNTGPRTSHKTKCADARGKDVEYLDRQDLHCPKNSALMRFEFTSEGCSGNQMRYKYECLPLKK